MGACLGGLLLRLGGERLLPLPQASLVREFNARSVVLLLESVKLCGTSMARGVGSYVNRPAHRATGRTRPSALFVPILTVGHCGSKAFERISLEMHLRAQIEQLLLLLRRSLVGLAMHPSEPVAAIRAPTREAAVSGGGERACRRGVDGTSTRSMDTDSLLSFSSCSVACAASFCAVSAACCACRAPTTSQ